MIMELFRLENATKLLGLSGWQHLLTPKYVLFSLLKIIIFNQQSSPFSS